MANPSRSYDGHGLNRPIVHISDMTVPCQEEGDTGSRFHLCVRLCYVRGRNSLAASHL